ncbi:MAG: accessory gene regulator B family protein [Desulfitobacteriaceae bacterium]|nr:accessory gene regulator B family protein [Desulfitobacteriaceae bacterium]MDD4347030.1 accessory gene regulator B family protein [Desulfitobacteriaceae bacterium]MDD4401107.1 accessory gene regulator B family protein [Desulfitobacteriaceae bacterium]
MNINYLSNKLADGITRELDYSEDKKEIIAYALETAGLFVIGALLIMLIGYILNAFWATVYAAVFGGLLRRVSGGAHFNSPLKCMIFGSIIYGLIGFLAMKLISHGLINTYFLILILLISFLLVSVLAPVDSKAKPLHSGSFKTKLKIASIVFIIVSFLIISLINDPVLSVSAVLGIFYQSITLLPFFNKNHSCNELI